MEKKLTAIESLIKDLEQFQKFPMVNQPTIEAAIEFARLRLADEKSQIIEAVNDYSPSGGGQDYYQSKYGEKDLGEN